MKTSATLAILIFCGDILTAHAAPCPMEIKQRLAPCTPSEAEKIKLVGLVREAIAARTALAQAEIDLRSMRQGASAHPNNPDMLEGWEAAWDRREAMKRAATRAVDAATTETIEIYGLSQLFAAGEIQSGPHRGSTEAPSIAVADNASFYYSSTDSAGRTRHYGYEFAPGGAVGGETMPDGRIFLSGRIFNLVDEQISPRLFAATLHHEAVHYRSLTSSGWTTLEAEEEKAYRASIDAADTFELLPHEKRDLYAEMALNARVPQSARKRLHDDRLEPYYAEKLVEQEEALEKIRKNEERLAINLRSARQERARQAASRVPSSDLIHDVAARTAWQAAYPGLESLADRACRIGPSGADQDSSFSFDWFFWRDTHYRQIEINSALALWADLSAFTGPVNCSTFIINQVVVARRSGLDRQHITPTWVTEVVAEAHRRTRPTSHTPPANDGRNPEMGIPGYSPEPPIHSAEPPPIPYCRHHPWCQEPNTRPRR